ncbi:hypothetical protein D3C73_417920 [compost metagenome]
MQTTGNLGLKKPDGTDIVDIADLNGNMDVLDTAVKNVQDHAVDTVKHITAAERTAWNAKASTAAATTTAAGLMAAADKAKLDGVAAGANKYVHPNHTGDVTSTGDGVTAIAPGVIVNADINAAAAIDATKIGTGVVSNAEFGYLDGVTAGIQGQLNGKTPLATTPQQTTADITYYVRTDGNDGNNGLANTAGGAFRTIGKAISMIPQIVNHTVTISVATGTYAEDVLIEGTSGKGYVSFVGTSTIIRSFVSGRCHRVTVSGFTATTTSTAGFSVNDGGKIDFTNCIITAASGKEGFVIQGGAVSSISSCTISNRNVGILSNDSSVSSGNNTGSGNTVALYTNFGSIYEIGTQPGGVIGVNGGLITSGVLNPWGDNTMNSRSAVGAFQTTGQLQPLGGGVVTKVLFPGLNYDHLGEFVSSRFTAKKLGIYLVTTTIAFPAPSTNNPVNVSVYVNNGNVAQLYNGILLPGATGFVSGAVQLKLNAGDYVEIFAITTQASTLIASSLLAVTQIA